MSGIKLAGGETVDLSHLPLETGASVIIQPATLSSVLSGQSTIHLPDSRALVSAEDVSTTSGTKSVPAHDENKPEIRQYCRYGLPGNGHGGQKPNHSRRGNGAAPVASTQPTPTSSAVQLIRITTDLSPHAMQAS